MSKKIKVEFWQKVKYYAEIEVSKKEFKLLQANDESDIKKYVRNGNRVEGNEVY